MTETTTAKRGGLAWQIARRLLPASSPARNLPDWPDAFSPEELAALQYPRDDPDTTKRERQGLIAALLASIEAGELVADTEQRTHTLQHGRRTAVSAYLAGENPRPRATPTPAAIQTDVPVITRPAFVAWHHAELAAPALSVHVLAWLGPENGTGKAKKAQDEIRAILKTMRKHDPELSLDGAGRLILPGHYAGFHGLCIGVSRSKHEGKDPLFAVTTEHFKKDYCIGLCTVLQKGPPRADDRDYYLKLAGEMGVKWTQPQEPKPRAKSESK